MNNSNMPTTERYPTLMKQGSANANALVSVPSAPSEVQRELDGLHVELGDLESIVMTLNERLIIVSHPAPAETDSGVTANCSSLIGQQISSSAYRVAMLAANLRKLTARLAI